MKYWVIVASRDHALRGAEGGFVQACHGKAGPLRRMRPGDGVVLYSPRQHMHLPDKCQAFTALGEVSDERVYPVEMTENFRPYRRNVRFFPCREVQIAPLVPYLKCLPDKLRWGYPFRYGFFEIGENDFTLIRRTMQTDHERHGI